MKMKKIKREPYTREDNDRGNLRNNSTSALVEIHTNSLSCSK